MTIATAYEEVQRKTFSRSNASMEIVEYKFGGIYLTVKIPLNNGKVMIEELYAENREHDFWIISRMVDGKPTHNTSRDKIYPISNRVRLSK